MTDANAAAPAEAATGAAPGVGGGHGGGTPAARDADGGNGGGGETSKVLTPLASGVAVALLVVYLLMLLFLVVKRSDAQWDRLVYLLGGLEALVFTGVGALFGTTVERKASATAAKDADKAKEDAAAQRVKAEEATKQAQRGEMLADAIRAKRAREGGGPGILRAQRIADPITSDVAELAALADRYFPD